MLLRTRVRCFRAVASAYQSAVSCLCRMKPSCADIHAAGSLKTVKSFKGFIYICREELRSSRIEKKENCSKQAEAALLRHSARAKLHRDR
ncbi:hypothetical protein KCP73_21720 [Salmonella enterica subsp. enterica]|nr:hypothetical protein KCP73_21720 [Salmonella enterica subsp. enterica]